MKSGRILNDACSETPERHTEEMSRARYATSGEPDSGALVLRWLTSAEARLVARRYLARSGFPTSDDLVDDVLGEAALGVVRRRNSGVATIENPAAYGTTVIKNVVYRLVRHQTDPLDDVAVGAVEDPFDAHAANDVRVIIGSLGLPSWLAAASLTYLTLLMYPAAVPDHAPVPVAGSRPDQARAWPSLWLAGLRDLFPDLCPERIRRRRARRIAEVLGGVDRAFARYRLQMERGDV